jgi:hypothetical protein
MTNICSQAPDYIRGIKVMYANPKVWSKHNDRFNELVDGIFINGGCTKLRKLGQVRYRKQTGASCGDQTGFR